MLWRVFILTYEGLHFSKDICPKFNCLFSFLNFLYSFVSVISRRCLICSSWSFEPLLSLSTSFQFEEGFVWSCQKLYTSPFTTSTSFMSRRGNRPIKAQTSVWEVVSRCSLLIEYLRRVFTFKLTSFDVCLRKRRTWCSYLQFLVTTHDKLCYVYTFYFLYVNLDFI